MIAPAIGAVLAGVFVFAAYGLFSWDSTDVDEVGLHYSGGPIEGRAFEALVPPSTSGTFYGPLDTVVKLPANQRTYIVSKGADGDRAGGDTLTAKNAEGVAVAYETTVWFRLNQDPQVLKEFYEQVCTKYAECYDDPDTNDDGWGRMLNDNVRKVQETTLQNASRRVSTDAVVQDANALQGIQEDVARQLTRTVNANLGGPFFEDIRFQINSVEVPEEVAKGYDRIKAAELLTQTRQQEVAQATAQADAARALDEASQSEGYIEIRRIEALQSAVDKGQVQFWVLPENATMNAPTPR